MIKFYLNDSEVQVEVSPSVTDTKDETLDSCQVTLKANDQRMPCEPDLPFRVEHDPSNVENFIVASDQVSVFSEYPLKYRHTLTLAQNTAKWKKTLLRNTVFSQPANDVVKGSSSVAVWLEAQGAETHSYAHAYSSPFNLSVPLDKKMKMSSMRERLVVKYLKIVGGVWTWSEATGLSNVQYSMVFTASNGDVKTVAALSEFSGAGAWKSPSSGLADWMNSHLGGPIQIRLSISEANLDTVGFDGYTDNGYISISYEFEASVYYYTMFDVLSILRTQASQNCVTSANPFKKPIPYALPSSGDFLSLLTSTIAPNLAFTQSTLYDALAETFKYFDGTMTLSKEGILGIEYFNEKGTDRTGLKFVGETLGWGQESHVDGLVSVYQNAKMRIQCPDSTRKTMGKLRSLTLGVPDKGSFAFVLPEPLDFITKVEIEGRAPIHATGAQSDQMGQTATVDVTEYFVERSLWTLLDKTSVPNPDGNFSRLLQNNSIPWDRGSKEINVSQYYQNALGWTYDVLSGLIRCALYKWLGSATDLWWNIDSQAWADFASTVGLPTLPASQNWSQVRMRIEYVAMSDGSARIESPAKKTGGEMLSNQANGEIDIKKMGLNMLGLAMKIGNPSLTASHEISSFADSVKKGDYFVDSEGAWVANSCHYQILADGRYSGTVEFTKDYNQLASRIQVDRSKRLSNISAGMAVKSEEIYTDYCYFSGDDSSIPGEYVGGMAIPSAKFSPMLSNTFECNVQQDVYIDFAYVYDMRYDDLSAAVNTSSYRLAIPLKKYGMGNCVCLETSYDSPINAGNELLSGQSGWWGGSMAYFSQAIKYADDSGFFDLVSLTFAQPTSDWADDYPKVTSYGTAIASLPGLKVCKKPNEVFAFNYEICFLPLPGREGDSFVGPKFVEENGIVIGKRKTTRNMRLYYETSDGFRYSPLDLKGHGSYVDVPTVSVAYPSSGRFNCSASVSLGEGTILKAWSLCDQEGNIYLASNAQQTVSSGHVLFRFSVIDVRE